MTKDELVREFARVRSAKSKTVQEIVGIWWRAPDEVREAALFLKRAVEEALPGLALRARNTGISAYGSEMSTGRERECFHIAVRLSTADIAVCHHGQAPDPRGLFHPRPRGESRIRYAYLQGDGLSADTLRYVVHVMLQSYRRLTGVDPER